MGTETEDQGLPDVVDEEQPEESTSHTVNVDTPPVVPQPQGKLPQGPKTTTKRDFMDFIGVFVPCMSIVSVVLFLRLGWAVGQAGVMGTLAMFAIGGLISILTDLSLSAIATKGRVAGGGMYHLLSKAIGPEVGGSIGMVFAAANVCGVAFYMQGLCETLKRQIPEEEFEFNYDIKLTTGVLITLALLCIFKSGGYSRAALFILCGQTIPQLYANLGLLVHAPKEWSFTSEIDSDLTVFGNFTGPSTHTLASNLWPDFDAGVTFGQVFAIVFPAMTGIMAGTNMSGVLRRPQAIPREELAAVGAAIFFYVLMIISLGASMERISLKNEYFILSRISWWRKALIAGVIVSTCSSAYVSLQNAARLLQALANDDIFPILSVFKTMWNGEPAIAIITATVLAFCLLVIGSLNVLAPVLTMFMLITYAATNFATFLYTIAGHPNFRPQFRLFSWFTGLFGGIICLVLMVYVSLLSTLVGLIIIGTLSYYISSRQPTPVGSGET